MRYCTISTCHKFEKIYDEGEIGGPSNQGESDYRYTLKTLASTLKQFMNFISRSKIRLKSEDGDSIQNALGLIFLVSFSSFDTTWDDLVILKNTLFRELL